MKTRRSSRKRSKTRRAKKQKGGVVSYLPKENGYVTPDSVRTVVSEI